MQARPNCLWAFAKFNKETHRVVLRAKFHPVAYVRREYALYVCIDVRRASKFLFGKVLGSFINFYARRL